MPENRFATTNSSDFYPAYNSGSAIGRTETYKKQNSMVIRHNQKGKSVTSAIFTTYFTDLALTSRDVFNFSSPNSFFSTIMYQWQLDSQYLTALHIALFVNQFNIEPIIIT